MLRRHRLGIKHGQLGPDTPMHQRGSFFWLLILDVRFTTQNVYLLPCSNVDTRTRFINSHDVSRYHRDVAPTRPDSDTAPKRDGPCGELRTRTRSTDLLYSVLGPCDRDDETIARGRRLGPAT